MEHFHPAFVVGGTVHKSNGRIFQIWRKDLFIYLPIYLFISLFYIFLFIYCLTLYSRIIHVYGGSHYYGEREAGSRPTAGKKPRPLALTARAKDSTGWTCPHSELRGLIFSLLRQNHDAESLIKAADGISILASLWLLFLSDEGRSAFNLSSYNWNILENDFKSKSY